MRQVHGVWRGTRSTTRGLYPVLSYARPSAFADIPIPSRYQWVTDDSYAYQPETDIPWAQKRPSLYWRGEPSGGGHGDHFYGSVFALPPADLFCPPISFYLPICFACRFVLPANSFCLPIRFACPSLLLAN